MVYMNKDNNCDKKYFKNGLKKRQNAIKSVNNYLSQLKIHYDLSDTEMYDILKIIENEYKKSISSKRWWRIFD